MSEVYAFLGGLILGALLTFLVVRWVFGDVIDIAMAALAEKTNQQQPQGGDNQ